MALNNLDKANYSNYSSLVEGPEIHLQLTTCISELATKLINLPAEEIPETISEAIIKIGKIFKTVTFLFYLKSDEGGFINIDSGINTGETCSNVIPDISWIERKITDNKALIFTSPRAIPPGAPGLREYFRSRSLSRLLLIPAVQSNGSEGFFWLEWDSPGHYNKEIIYSSLSKLGIVILNALERHQREVRQHLLHDQIINNLSDIVCLIDNQGLLKYIIPACKKLLGNEAEELTGTSFYELVYEDDLARVKGVVEHLLTEPTSGKLDLRLRHSGGDYIWSEAIFNLLHDTRGKVSGLMVNIRDISDRKKIEETLIQKNGEMRLLLDNINAHVFYLKDPETNGYVNRAAAKFIGKTKEEMKDSKLRDVFSDKQADRLIKKNQLVFKKKEKMSYEVHVENKNGETRTLLNTVTPKLDEENNVRYAICAALDITENRAIKEKLVRSYLQSNKLARKLERTNKRLKENQKLFRINFEESYIGMVIAGSDFNFIRVNRAFSGMMGYTKTELKKLSITDITHPDDLEKTSFYIDRLMNGEIKSAKFEKRYLNKSGQVIWVNIHSTLVRDENGNPLFILSQIEDITSRKRIETIFNQQKEELEYSRLKTHFFANLSHELRTPLNLIFSTLKLLTIYKDKHLGLSTDRRFSRYIRLIRHNGYRLLRMVNNLIDLTRLDSDYYNLNMGNYDITTLVNKTVSSTKEYILSKNRNLLFHTINGKRLISCDQLSIERILLNLISNALKFTTDGDEIVINLQDQGENILISVKDNGIGIKKEKLPVIFEPFRQCDDNIFKRNNEGSGMGLAIVKKLVELHGGKVWVESEYGQGSEFFVELPVKLLPENSAVSTSELSHNVPQELIDRVIMEFSDL